MPIPDERPPEGTQYELSEYLYRLFTAARYEDDESNRIRRYTLLPNRPEIAKLYYFDNAIAGDPDITAEGLYLYKSTGYVFIV